jgi:excisionase family DNA binding protein
MVGLEHALEALGTTRPTLYRWLRTGQVKAVKLGRRWRFRPADLDAAMRGEAPRISLPVSIDPLLASLEQQVRRLAPRAPLAPGQPVERAVHLMIQLAELARARQIHLEPSATGGGVQGWLRLRIDAELETRVTFDVRALGALVEGWKRLARCNPEERGLPQQGQVPPGDGRGAGLAVSFLPTHLGESVVANLEDGAGYQVPLEQMGLSPANLERVRRGVSAPFGALICSGPTGSGKTTMLYAWLGAMDCVKSKVIAVEDPVGWPLPGVTHIPVNERIGLTYGRAVKAALESQPDIVMIGEINGRESLELALRAAASGYLVVSTVHASSAVETLERLADLGLEPGLVSDAVRLIVNQRLIRQMCPRCAVAARPDRALREQLRTALEPQLPGWMLGAAAYRAAGGCTACGQTGYRGRVLVSEVLEVTPHLARALRRGAPAGEVRALALKQGMVPLVGDALRLAATGATTLAEVLRVAVSLVR